MLVGLLNHRAKHSNGTEEDADLLAEAAAIMNNPDSVLAGIDFGAEVEADCAIAA